MMRVRVGITIFHNPVRHRLQDCFVRVVCYIIVRGQQQDDVRFDDGPTANAQKSLRRSGWNRHRTNSGVGKDSTRCRRTIYYY